MGNEYKANVDHGEHAFYHGDEISTTNFRNSHHHTKDDDLKDEPPVITAVATTLTAPSQTKKRKRGGPRLHKSATLTNETRDELHIQIYKYFTWLLQTLQTNQTSFNGRLKLKDISGWNENGVKDVLSIMESAFEVVSSIRGAVTDEPPLLEYAIDEPLGQLTDARLQTKPSHYHSQWYDFDDMLVKLQDYKSVHGNCNVPSRYKLDPRLGKWVCKLREKKTALTQKGQEYETPKNAKSLTSRTLTKERVDALTSMGFEWRIKSANVSWEVRYQELTAFYQEYGRWPSRKHDGGLGIWAHNQRNMYTKKDDPVALERYHRLDEIGFPWDPTGKRAAKYFSADLASTVK